jgi:hypothetical protein
VRAIERMYAGAIASHRSDGGPNWHIEFRRHRRAIAKSHAAIERMPVASPMPRMKKAGGTQVDLQLVVTVDVSRPMDNDEAVVARRGYVEAFRSPEFIQAIRQGSLGRIAVTFVEWSDPDVQIVVLPWTVIDGSQAVPDLMRPMALRLSSIGRLLPLLGDGRYSSRGLENRSGVQLPIDGPHGHFRSAAIASGAHIIDPIGF